MKLHKDGTLDGTPAEIAEYQRLMEKKEAYKQPPNPYIDQTTWPQSVKITSGANTYGHPLTPFMQHLFNALHNDTDKH